MLRLAYLMRIPASPLEQYEKLICEPLKALQLTNKILVVIDALDECDNRREILEALSRNELPSEMRVIVTTRPEYDIMETLGSHSHVQPRHLRLDEPGIEDDILLYFTSQFENAGTSFGTEEMRKLTQKAGGLFRWASTACRYITNRSRPGTNVRRRYERILSEDDMLDGLYRAILQDVLTSDAEGRKPVLAALATILAASVPLPISAFKELCTTEEERQVMDEDIPLLGSVFDIHLHTPIRPIHNSFRDYLTDRKRSNEFFVDLTCGHENLALNAFTKMNRELRFNMFDIRTSHHDFNTLIGDKSHPLLQPASALQYSCRYWIDHIRALDMPSPTSGIKEQIKKFMTENLLFWLEVIAALKCLHIAARDLEEVSSSLLVRISSRSLIQSNI
jgi:hypothetical protein